MDQQRILWRLIYVRKESLLLILMVMILHIQGNCKFNVII
ncbi:hypothetical protein [Polaromonas sp. CG9_12]|nr:hypothetical protein [Polaromonas sp. CG9_12]